MALPRYDMNHAGIGKLLVDGDMGDAMRVQAEVGKQVAIGLSPRDTGEYAASFEVDTELDRTGRSPRQVAIVANTAEHAVVVEWGRAYPDGTTTDGHHVLSRVADMLGGA